MPELMTVEELGQYLRFTNKTVYKMLKQGAIPGIKIGNKWRFEKKAIDNWLHNRMKGKKARVLVVDDDGMIRALFRETLEKEGHTVIGASTGAEGIKCVKESDFDLVFLDLKMPGMDGVELFKQIKIAKPELPVTIVSGYPGSEMMERAIKHGPLGIMNKPFKIADIIMLVNSYLRTRQST